MSKTYGQYCGLARALDHVGDRWTLLIVRELLIDHELGFRDLAARLPGVAPNLLVDRLRQMVADGIVDRSDAPRRSKAVRYSLTELGRSLEPAILALIRWGTVWMRTGPDQDLIDERWGVIALRALLDSRDVRSPRGQLQIRVADVVLTVALARTGRSVRFGEAAQPRASIVGDLPSVLAVASGSQPLAASGLRVTGDGAFARAALAAGPVP